MSRNALLRENLASGELLLQGAAPALAAVAGLLRPARKHGFARLGTKKGALPHASSSVHQPTFALAGKPRVRFYKPLG